MQSSLFCKPGKLQRSTDPEKLQTENSTPEWNPKFEGVLQVNDEGLDHQIDHVFSHYPLVVCAAGPPYQDGLVCHMGADSTEECMAHGQLRPRGVWSAHPRPSCRVRGTAGVRFVMPTLAVSIHYWRDGETGSPCQGGIVHASSCFHVASAGPGSKNESSGT